ncbi:hypothetical protein HUT19_15275 [Streptomyces sp. NA02950]|uniref:hypothetical protein n=1 Tax=Streptomyces sp. NA02950 TaxID=2742137 RepID=UPI001592A3D7|nr:hypothetical protein [Streptomyces sp. NA02950]QKV92951.1 hypothetical protein HUT19_15275 [Streptomyces sp. NA02950]
MDEVDAAPGLRTAVGFYTGKVDRLRQRQADLEAELEAVRAELAKASSARDQLAEALEEILADAPAPQEEPAAASPPGPAPEPEDVPTPPREDKATGAGDRSEHKHQKPSGKRATARSTASGELMQAVLQILVTAGRPLSAKDITEALGRPTTGQEGRAPIETTRRTCKRLVKNGRAVEDPVGVFAVARAEEPPVKGAA